MVRYGGAAAAQIDALTAQVMWRGMTVVLFASVVASWWMFHRLEAIDGGGREVRLPAWLPRARAGGSMLRRQHPIRRLIVKELHLQHLPLAVSFLVLLVIGAIPTWPYSSGWGYGPSGVLGTGRMGAAMVRRLRIADVDLLIYNRTRETAESVAARRGAPVTLTSHALASSGRYWRTRRCAAIASLLDRWSPDEPVDVVGHDWGAAITYALCIVAPQRVRRAVTLAVPHPLTFVRQLRDPAQLVLDRASTLERPDCSSHQVHPPIEPALAFLRRTREELA